jgi:hypothetical protein
MRKLIDVDQQPDVPPIGEVAERVRAAAALARHVAAGEIDPGLGLAGVVGLLERAQEFIHGEPRP